MEALSNLLNILKVALGLGFVIFLHELGHFLLAKWNNVKVEKFSIGFGPTLLGFTKGETEYVLAAIPLGGFVKMLGEGPEEEANKSTDPRAYPNKSVPARMAIISAGVIMNLILGLACFVYAYGQGMDEVPTIVGAVIAGGPAYQAGVKAGDEIVSIDGRRDLSFTNVTLKVRLSGQGQVLHFEVKRPGQDALIPVDLEPRRDATAEVPGIGIYPSESLILASTPWVAPAGLTQPLASPDAGLKPKDKVLAFGPEGQEPVPVTDILDWNRRLAMYRDKPIRVVYERLASGDGESADGPTTRQEVVLPPNRFVDLGMRMTIEPIVAVSAGSPAEKAGFRRGDRIVKFEGHDDFDPMRLPSLCHERAGAPLTFEVERTEDGGSPRIVTLTATPNDTPPWVEVILPYEPLDIPGLGLAYRVRSKVASVEPGSPAEKAGIKVGDVVNRMTIPPLKVGKRTGKAETFEFTDERSGWSNAFQLIQLRPLEPIEIVVNNGSTPMSLTPTPVDDWFHTQRGLQFEFLIRRTPTLDVATALRKGFHDTIDNILSIYAMFRSLAQSRVSPKNLGGPILIAQVAYSAADSSFTDLIHFLGILSINLAVLNFLPVPPLDGGQMVFLGAEWVRGRPLPESALIAGTYIGLLLVLCLMAFVMFQDVSRIVMSYF